MAASNASDIPESKSDYCPCNRCTVARKQGEQEIIDRVRELADFYDGKESENNPMGYGQLKNESNSISHIVAADNIRKALDGEQ